MAKMSTAGALKLSHRINKVLRPFEQATEILHAACEAERGLGQQRKEATQLEGDMANQRSDIADLAVENQRALDTFSDLQRKTVAEKALLATAETQAATVRETIRLDTAQLHTSFAELKEGFQSEINELEAHLQDLQEEEARIDAKITQFEALTTGADHVGD